MKPRPRKSQLIHNFLPNVPEEKRTAAWKIFHIKYRCKVAQIHTESLEYLEQRPPEGNEYQGAGKARAEQLVVVSLSTAAMASMVAEGATIMLIDPKDAMRIYNDVRQHLTDWQQYSLTSIHGRRIPEEDLRCLDNFAAQIYPYARHDIQVSGSDLLFANSPMAKIIHGGSGLGGFSGLSRFSKEQRQAREIEARGSHDVAEQHSSMVNAILDPKIRKTKWTRDE